MKKTKTSLILSIIIVISGLLPAQDSIINVRLGLKKLIPDTETEKLISKNEYNYIDAYEYELAKYLVAYAKTQKNYKLTLVPISQSNKLEAITSGINIDALLYTFSETNERRDSLKIIFSEPYFQNRAIGIITNNKNINTKELGSELIRIGHVKNTTSGNELKKVKARNDENIILSGYDNHEKLMLALKLKEIDAAAGDVSRLVYETNGGEFHFGGNLPTNRSKVGDNYCIAITPNKEKLKPFFDNFLESYDKKIQNLEKRLMSASVNDAYGLYYNSTEDKLKNYIKYLAIGAVLSLALLSFIFYSQIKRKEKIIKQKNGQLEAAKKDELDTHLGKMMSDYEIKIQDVLNAEEIAQAGCNFFDNAKKSITYVGSGGFLSDKAQGDKWLKALKNCLDRGINFERVVDLPAMTNKKHTKEGYFAETNSSNTNKKLGIHFTPRNNFLPENLEKNFISRYLKWLVIQHSSLKTYSSNLKLINSRGAALWGYGIVILIKDQKEVLIFTTDKKSKSGTVLPNNKLANQIFNVISEIKTIGKEICCNNRKDDLLDMFFSKDSRLEDIVLNKELENIIPYINEAEKVKDAEMKKKVKAINKVFDDIEEEFNDNKSKYYYYV